MDNERYSSVSSHVEYTSLEQLMQLGLTHLYTGKFEEALAVFSKASDRNPRSAPALKCAALMKFLFGKDDDARNDFRRAEVIARANESSILEANVYDHVRSIVMMARLHEMIEGSVPRAVFPNRTLSSRPQKLKSKSTDSQNMHAWVQFVPTIRRNGDDFILGLKMTCTNHGVSECLKGNDCTGPFILELELKVSPKGFRSECVTASPGDESSADHVVQRTTARALNLQVQSSATPSSTISGNISNSTSTSMQKYGWSKSIALHDRTSWSLQWVINTQRNGEHFDLSKKYNLKVPELPVDPTDVNHNLESQRPPFECKWEVSDETARRCDFKFQWDLTLSTKIAYATGLSFKRRPMRAPTVEEKFDPVTITSDFRDGVERLFAENLNRN